MPDAPRKTCTPPTPTVPAPPPAAFRIRRVARESDAAVRDTRRAITRAARGDPDALRDLYVRYADNVYSYVVYDRARSPRGRGRDAARLHALPAALVRYEDRGAPFLSWLLRLARNAALDQLRSRRAIPVSDPIAAAAATDGDPERLTALRDALRALPAPQREILVLRHLAGLAPSEIATRLRAQRECGARPAPPRPAGPASRAASPGRRSGDAHPALSATRRDTPCCYRRCPGSTDDQRDGRACSPRTLIRIAVRSPT